MVKEPAGRNFAILTQKYSNKIKQILIRRLQANFNFDKHLTKEFANLHYKKNSTPFTSYCIYLFHIVFNYITLDNRDNDTNTFCY